MKLLTYLDSQNQHRVGLLARSGVVDILEAVNWLNTQTHTQPLRQSVLPVDMLTVIREQENLIPAFQRILLAEEEKKLPNILLRDEKGLQLLAPIPRPVSMRDGYAFRQHVEAARRNRGVPMIPEFDQFPVFYFTNHLAVTGPGDVRVEEKTLEKLDYELEVAVVIGKQCRNVKAEEADSVIFGYTIMNDWSARALQTEEMKMSLGPAKGKDFATSLGPYLVTRDELSRVKISGMTGDRHDLKMKAFLNGKLLSEGNLRDMTWTFAQIIERVSYGVTLYPGEVIGSGTVGTGCLMELNGSKITQNLWLKPGDDVVLEVDLLGRLRNTIVRV